MRFTTKTEYGILCMVHLAKHADQPCISIKDMAESQKYPVAFIEKILQMLKKAGLVLAFHGNQGGYALAREATEINLKQIIEALEGATFEAFCEPDVRTNIVCTHFCLCGVKPVWRKTKQILDNFYESITLEMLTKNEIEIQQAMRVS